MCVYCSKVHRIQQRINLQVDVIKNKSKDQSYQEASHCLIKQIDKVTKINGLKPWIRG